MIVEYTLRNSRDPIGVSEYRLTEALPENLKAELPKIEDLEAELDSAADEANNSGDS